MFAFQCSHFVYCILCFLQLVSQLLYIYTKYFYTLAPFLTIYIKSTSAGNFSVKAIQNNLTKTLQVLIIFSKYTHTLKKIAATKCQVNNKKKTFVRLLFFTFSYKRFFYINIFCCCCFGVGFFYSFLFCQCKCLVFVGVVDVFLYIVYYLFIY